MLSLPRPLIVIILLLAVVIILLMSIDSTSSQVNGHNMTKANKTVSNLSNSITLANNRSALNASNQIQLEFKVAPNVSAVFTLKKQTPMDLNILKNNSNMTYVISKCCQATTNEPNNDLEGIKESINQIKKSFDDSTSIGLGLGLLAIAVSIITPYLYEKAKKPNLRVQIGEPSIGHSEKYLHCKVVNLRLQHWFGIERNPAINTRVTMEFFRMDGKSHIPTSITWKIPAKWVSAPEPLTPDRSDFDSTKLALLYRETIPSGYDGEPFVVAVKHSGDTGCYIVTGDNYQPDSSGKILRNDKFRIEESKFLVNIQATSGNSSSRMTTFMITNEAEFEKFMIYPYTKKDKS